MAYRDLRDFLRRLKESGELHRVMVEVDPVLEIAEIADRVSKMEGGGKALVFQKVKGSAFSTAVNLFGSYRRICLALECERLDNLSLRVEEFLVGVPAESQEAWWRHLSYDPVGTAAIPCREIIDHSPDLESYPFLKTWPDDSGRAATLPLVFSSDPETGRENCGMYRMQVLSPNMAAIHWSGGSGGGLHWAKYRERGERMPVAIAFGGDPALVCAAMLPLPEQVDEMRFAGFLRGAPVRVAGCLTSPLMVPAHAEVVIEGFVEPDEAITDCVFGNHTGFYAPAPDAAIINVTCISRRKKPVLPATVVGRPPMEDCWLAKAAERLIVPFIRLEFPEIADINLPIEWIFNNSAIVAINKKHPGHAREVIRKLRTGEWLRKARVLVIVDSDIDVQDLSLVAWRVVNFVDWQKDMVIGCADVEHAIAASALPGSGAFVGIDATRKGPEERSGREWPGEIGMDEAVKRLVDTRWHEYGF
jgi:4-hydroxy-3-polyprenylbenzoate decarboxylase